jgi:membrane-associated phospholipid phosphatase
MMWMACVAAIVQAGEWDAVKDDARLYATAPVRWDARDWGILAAAVGGTALLVPLADRSVNEWMKDHQDAKVSRAADVVRQVGNGWWTVPMVGGLWGVGWALESPREQKVAREATEALVFSAVVSQAFKYGLGRRRPSGTDDPMEWNVARGGHHGNAFPSGHAQMAWSVLTVIGLEYRDVPGIAPLAFATAGACTISRVYDQRHWTSDALAGSLLGFASAWAVVKWNRAREIQATPQGVTLHLAF